MCRCRRFVVYSSTLAFSCVESIGWSHWQGRDTWLISCVTQNVNGKLYRDWVKVWRNSEILKSGNCNPKINPNLQPENINRLKHQSVWQIVSAVSSATLKIKVSTFQHISMFIHHFFSICVMWILLNSRPIYKVSTFQHISIGNVLKCGNFNL